MSPVYVSMTTPSMTTNSQDVFHTSYEVRDPERETPGLCFFFKATTCGEQGEQFGSGPLLRMGTVNPFSYLSLLDTNLPLSKRCLLTCWAKYPGTIRMLMWCSPMSGIKTQENGPTFCSHLLSFKKRLLNTLNNSNLFCLHPLFLSLSW